MEEEERSDPGKPPVRTGSADSDGHAGEPVRILYVDDDADMAGFFRIYISRLGSFEISHSKNGREALSFLKDGGECDIIISDYDMPGMDGITLLKEIGLLPSPPPFILFTGKGREEVVIEAINNGAAFYLQKGGSLPNWSIRSGRQSANRERNQQSGRMRRSSGSCLRPHVTRFSS